jgi:hypothetical protein
MRARLLSEVAWEAEGPPVVYLVFETHGSAVAVHRYDGAGRLVGDSIHVSMEEATAQVEAEFGGRAGRFVAFDQGRESVAKVVLERARQRYAAASPGERILAYARVKPRTLWTVLKESDVGISGELLWCGLLLGTFALVLTRAGPMGLVMWQDLRRAAGVPAGEGLAPAAVLGLACVAAGLFLTERRGWHCLFAAAAALLMSGCVVQGCLLLLMEQRVGGSVMALVSAAPFFCVVRWRLRAVAERLGEGEGS